MDSSAPSPPAIEDSASSPADSASDSGTNPALLVPMIDEALQSRCPSPNDGAVLHPGTSLHQVTLAGKGRCNDGTPPLLYIRAATDPAHEADWVWFFDGGSFCANNEQCAIRWCGENFPFGRRHMSSLPLPEEIGGDGIMSFDPANTFAGWNMVYAVYCSSDAWTGTASDVVLDGDPAYRLHFEGAFVGQDGIDAGVAGLTSDDGLVVLPPLGEAARILSSGTSAGCGGAVTHSTALQAAAPGAEVTTVLDSCFKPAPEVLAPEHQKPWLDQQQRFYEENSGPVWMSQLDPACVAAHPGQEWRCTDMDTLMRGGYLGRVMTHHDQGDGVLYDFFAEAGMSMADYAQAAIDTFRLYEATEPQIAIHSNNCGEHTTIDGDGTFLRFTVIDAVNPGPALSFHDVLVGSLAGEQPVAVDSSPPTTSACAP